MVMSAFLRGALLGAGLIGAFFAGYVLRNPPSFRSEPAPALAQELAKPVSSRTVAAPPNPVQPSESPSVAPPIHLVSSSKEQYTPKINFNTIPPQDAHADPDPNDLALQIIKNRIGINTNVLGDPQPVPAVLAEARKNAISPPDLIPLPKMGPTPLPELPPITGVTIGAPEILKPKFLLNQRDIALDFEITRMGFSKIVAVELWTTRDEGKTWQTTDRKEGCESPLRTRLWSEGDYGFKMVFESETGIKTPEPKPGQNPDFGLILDTTPPKVKLEGLFKYDIDPRSVTIGWSSQDERLDPSFIRLEYSLNGIEWNEIPDVKPRALQTAFDFKWSMPEDLPPRVQLRVTTRDQAGNYGMAQTSVGAIIDLVEPAGKIIGIRDENAKPEVGPLPRVIE